MKVIPPIVLDHTNTSIIGSSDFLDPSEWDTALSYSVDDRVKVTTGNINRIYQCILPTTASDDSPEIDVTKITPKWVDLGYINKYAMFDTLRSSQTFAERSMVVTITPGQTVDAIAIINTTNVLQYNITATDAGSVVRYNRNVVLNKRITTSWYTYFFGRFWSKAASAFFDLPTSYGNLTITITFSGDVQIGVGTIVLGNSVFLGSLQNGATVDALNFSSIERDAFGTASLVPRRNVPKTNQTLYIDKSLLNNVLQYKEQLDSVPAVWSGLDDQLTHPYFDATLILGFYRNFSFDISNPIGVYISLELEEI